MYEHRHEPLLPLAQFYGRAFRGAARGLAILLVALFAGMVGYHVLEKLSWLDAFLNASMILFGMGPVAVLQTDAGKFFAGCYAMFGALIFAIALTFVLAPFAHRFMHRFHRARNGREKEGAHES